MKRFTATEKWDKEWFRKLPLKHKVLWLYLCDRCDAAGVWEPDFELASFQIGSQVSEDDLALFGDRVEKLSEGKFWLTRFIEFQYQKLSEDCRGQVNVFSSLKRHSLYDRVCKGYPIGPKTGQEGRGLGMDLERKGEFEGGQRKPRSVDEVVAKGQIVGVSEQDCRQWFSDCEACGWRRGDGTLFDNWPRQLCIYRDKLRANGDRGGGNGIKKPLTTFDLKNIIAAKQATIDSLKIAHCSDVAMGETWNNQEARGKCRKLRLEIKQLTEQLSKMA